MSRCEPCVILILGATGDLARRKLLPALFALHRDRFLHSATPVVCVSREPMDAQAYAEWLNLPELLSGANRDAVDGFREILRYAPFDYTQQGLPALEAAVEAISQEAGAGPNRAVYLALPPQVFESTAALLAASRLFGAGGWRRVCFEKPFGHDLASAAALNAAITRHYDEHEIYRIDHYLGKELVRNLLVLRFANPLFEQIWNGGHIDHVQVTIAETLGVERRAGYYERSGALRDMLQNHMMQVLALAAMEPPATLDAEALRDAMAAVIRSLEPAREEDVVAGQYGEGRIDGRPVAGYRAEPGVDRRSAVETFVALRARIANDRWRGVPFFLRTGKRLDKSFAEVNVVLRDVPGPFAGLRASLAPNVVSIRIQPEEGISVQFNVKAPGEAMRLDPALLEHCHHCTYGIGTPAAYEILLHEFLEGDPTLFTRWDFVQASWAYVDPIGRMLAARPIAFPNYAAGSGGPAAADALLGEGRRWFAARDIHAR